MKYSEIKEKLTQWMEENHYGVLDLANDLEYLNESPSELKSIFGKVKVCENNTRTDSQVETVLYFVDHNVYISWTGDYSSWDAPDYSYSEMCHCKPKEITQIIYEWVEE